MVIFSFFQLIDGSLRYKIKTQYVGKLWTSECCIAIRIDVYIKLELLNKSASISTQKTQGIQGPVLYKDQTSRRSTK